MDKAILWLCLVTTMISIVIAMDAKEDAFKARLAAEKSAARYQVMIDRLEFR